MQGDIAANWGVISHGQQIPIPTSSSGYTFSYDECSWMVSPFTYDDIVDFLDCSTDDVATVTMQYSVEGSGTLVDGAATYLIVGIRDNVNLGTTKPIPSTLPSPTPTPTPTATPSPTVAATVTPSPTPGATVTPTISVTPSETPPPGVTSTPTPTPTNTPSVTPSETPPVSPTSTPVVTATPTPTPSVSPPTPLSATTTDYVANPGASLSGISAVCDIDDHIALPDDGITNCASDTFGACALEECAPEPGGNLLGPQMRLTVSGGVAPYTVRVKNVTNASQIPAGECIDLGWPGTTNITNATSSAATISTFIIATDGGFQNGGAMTGSCNDNLYFASGNFDLEIEDDNGTIITVTKSWQSARVNTGGIE